MLPEILRDNSTPSTDYGLQELMTFTARKFNLTVAMVTVPVLRTLHQALGTQPRPTDSSRTRASLLAGKPHSGAGISTNPLYRFRSNQQAKGPSISRASPAPSHAESEEFQEEKVTEKGQWCH